MRERPSIEQWIRLGYAMRGLLFVALGYLAWTTGRGQTAMVAVARLKSVPGGALILLLLGVGLVGLALFRLAEAWFDLDGRGGNAAGKLTRAGRALGGLAYGAVGAGALAIVAGAHGGTAMREGKQIAAHGPGLLLILAGVGLMIAAAAQVSTALTGRFMRELDGATPPSMRWLGAAGYAARGIVFAMLGWATVKAGVGGARLRDSGQVLDTLSQHHWLYQCVTYGLVLFGIFSLAESRCRRIPGGDSLGRRASAEIRSAL